MRRLYLLEAAFEVVSALVDFGASTELGFAAIGAEPESSAPSFAVSSIYVFAAHPPTAKRMRKTTKAITQRS